MAAYGRTSHLTSADNHDLGDKVTGPGTAGQFTQEAGLLTYLEVINGISCKNKTSNT